MLISVNAVVICEKKINDYDRVLTLLTENKGIIHAYAKGASKIKSGMMASTEMFCYSSFQIFTRGDKSFIDKAEVINIFFGLRKDLLKISLATYFCQLMSELVPPFECQDAYIRLLLNSLHYLEKDKLERDLLKPLFELRILTLSGYMPDLVVCEACGTLETERVFFSPTMGNIFCENCYPKNDSSLIEVTGGAFAAMRHIVYSDISKLFKFGLGEESKRILNRVSRAYLLCQVEKMLPALRYYEQITGGVPPQA